MDDFEETNTSAKDIPSKICEAPFSIGSSQVVVSENSYPCKNGDFTMENGNSVKIAHSLESMGCTTEISSTTIPYEKSKTSVLWKYFKRIGHRTYKCCICKILMRSHSNSTTNFLEHVKWNHPEEYREALIGKQFTCEVPHSFESDGGEWEEYEGEYDDYEGELEDDGGEYGDYEGEYEDYDGEYEDEDEYIPKSVKTDRINHHERIVWENVKIISPSLCKCNICNKMLAYKDSSATNLLRHMKHKHPEKYQEQLKSISDWTSQSGAQANENKHESQDVPRKRKKRSIVWQYMEMIAPKKAKCVLCSKIMTLCTSYATSYMLKHLQVKHAIFKGNDEEKVVVAHTSEEVPRTGKGKKRSIVWKYMKLVGTSNVKCVLCNKILNYWKRSTTAHLLKHLQVEHDIVKGNKTDISKCSTSILGVGSYKAQAISVNEGQNVENSQENLSHEPDLNSDLNQSTYSPQGVPIDRKNRSIIWAYMKRVDPSNVKCVLCNKIMHYKKRSTTSYILKHLQVTHAIVKGNTTDILEVGQHNLSSCEGQVMDNRPTCESLSLSLNPKTVYDFSSATEFTEFGQTIESISLKEELNSSQSRAKPLSINEGQDVENSAHEADSTHTSQEGMGMKRSIIWKYMKLVGPSNVKCVLCGKVLKYWKRSSTSHILKHLQVEHAIVKGNKADSKYSTSFLQVGPHNLSSCEGQVMDATRESLTLNLNPKSVHVRLKEELNSSQGTSQRGAQILSVTEEQDVENSHEDLSHESDLSSDLNQSTHTSQEAPRTGDRRIRSIIWKYMKLVGTSKVKCVLCNKILNYWKLSSTSHIFKHLRVEHGTCIVKGNKTDISKCSTSVLGVGSHNLSPCEDQVRTTTCESLALNNNPKPVHDFSSETELTKLGQTFRNIDSDVLHEISEGASQSGAQTISVFLVEGEKVIIQENPSHEPDRVSDPDKIKSTNLPQEYFRTRKKRSIVWQYMEIVGPSKAKCVLCSKIFNYCNKYAISHLLKHLQIKHAIIKGNNEG